MAAYIWPAPEIIGTAEIPPVVSNGLLSILRGIPDDKAVVLEFANREHQKHTQKVIGSLAHKFAVAWHTKCYITDDGAFRMLIWREDRRDARSERRERATGKRVWSVILPTDTHVQ